MSRASRVGALHDGGLHLAGVKAALPEQETQNSTCPDAGVTPKKGGKHVQQQKPICYSSAVFV